MWDYDINELQTPLLIASFILIITYFLLIHLKEPKNLPSGPWGLPIVGYRLFLGKKPHVTVANMRNQYGDLLRLNMGNEKVVVLNSFKAIKEALGKQADIFAARQQQNIPNKMKNFLGIVMSNGDVWSELRRFSLSKLRDFGFGKSSLEPQIKDEIQHFLEEVDAFKRQPILDITGLLRKSITNVICIIMAGKRFDYNDKIFNKLLNLSKEVVSESGIDRLASLIPKIIRFKFLIKILRIRSSMHAASEMREILTTVVGKIEEKYDTESQKNFIEVWLNETLDTNSQNKHLTKKHLPIVLLDLFIAGSDTTTNTIGWSMLYMIDHPEIQVKVQQEIDDIVGRERTPSMSDQRLMPYTEAVLMEVQRIVTIVPLSVSHCNLCDTTVLGKFIPKETTIVPNLWAVHHDAEIFPEPDKFKPERFLTENGEVKRVEEFIPFSMGKRQCMGESLARIELFLYFTSMLQQFTFKKVRDSVDFDYDYSVVTMSRPQPIYAITR